MIIIKDKAKFKEFVSTVLWVVILSHCSILLASRSTEQALIFSLFMMIVTIPLLLKKSNASKEKN